MLTDLPSPPSSPTVLQQLLMVVSIPGHRKPESPLQFRVWSDRRLSYVAEAVAEKLGVAAESIGFNDVQGNALTRDASINELDLGGVWFNEGYGHWVEAVIPA
ncbi:hypothetical protein FN846DRAFT_894358 [Sphaerosporella brunnea]|uniref:Uncharacterized protein n=1 Tax=Sphaerosporella brunnea TaxID=1250544 RepID=A0A5J5EHQ3_9PEZI|nr:hypothetical protein FN846DRAFT_894358 [Sphaerosporella brunnea]